MSHKASTWSLLLVMRSSGFAFVALVYWLSACCFCCLLPWLTDWLCYVAVVPQRERCRTVCYRLSSMSSAQCPQAGRQKQLRQHASCRLPCWFTLGASSPPHSLRHGVGNAHGLQEQEQQQQEHNVVQDRQTCQQR